MPFSRLLEDATGFSAVSREHERVFRLLFGQCVALCNCGPSAMELEAQCVAPALHAMPFAFDCPRSIEQPSGFVLGFFLPGARASNLAFGQQERMGGALSASIPYRLEHGAGGR